MTDNAPSERRFAQDVLPWVVAVAALIFYVVTLNHWVTFSSLSLNGKIIGWDKHPMLFQPLLFLLTLPCRWLPASLAPLVLNLLTAFSAAATLWLLTRAVSLLPYDRLDKPSTVARNEHALLTRHDAWVPPLFAAIALGLQLSFWEHATAATGDMLDVLLFAYLLRCVLEYRVDGQRFWLDRAAVTCGLAVANSWAMIGLPPLFFIVLVWMMRRHILDLRFVIRMVLLLAAGLSFLLVLPLAQAVSPDSPLGFFKALRAVLSSYKSIFHTLAVIFLRQHRDVTVLLASFTLVPVLVMSIRWGGFFREDSPLVRRLMTFSFYIVHGFLLLVCLWMMLDPTFSPRNLGTQLGLPMSFLLLYFLGALSVGYYSGFFLVVFSRRPRNSQALLRARRWLAPKLIYSLCALAFAGLLWRNAAAIFATNGPALDQYARLAAKSLPPEGAVVLSEDPVRLELLQAALAREGRLNGFLPVETAALPVGNYRAYLKQRYPDRWPDDPPGANAEGTLTPTDCLKLMLQVARTNRVFHLQPASSYLVEPFYLEQQGLTYELKRRPAHSFQAPALDAVSLERYDAYWQYVTETDLPRLLKWSGKVDLASSDFKQRLLRLTHLQAQVPATIEAVSSWYASAFNEWGVMLQRNSQTIKATSFFTLAKRLNEGNLPATANLECNQQLIANRALTVEHESLLRQPGAYRSWSELLANNGAFDEPSYCYQLGLAFAEGGLMRQAGEQLERAQTLAPGDVMARIAFAEALERSGMIERAIKTAREIQSDTRLQPLAPTNKLSVALLETRAWYAETAISKNATNHAAIVHAAYQSYTNALRVADELLESTPNNLFILLNKGSLSIMAGDFSNAIPPLTRSLDLTNTYPARLNRALAYYQMDRLDAAREDYDQLLKAFPQIYQAYQGLGEIAFKKKDTNTAILHYEQYLAKAPADAPEVRLVTQRLKTLRGRAE